MRTGKSFVIRWTKPCTAYLLRDAAWSFAVNLLWKDRKFSFEEEELAKSYLFTIISDRKKAFLSFCERVILAAKYRSAKGAELPEMPSEWLDINNLHGYAETKSWLATIKKQRQHKPGYLRHISIIARYYLKFVLRPSAAVYQKGCEMLAGTGAFALLQQFYGIIDSLGILNKES